MTGRALMVVAAGLLLAIFVVRSAFVDAFAAGDPQKAAVLWPGHPSVILTSGLEEVGTAAAAGRPVSQATVQRMIEASARAPLAPEPFLVRGVDLRLRNHEMLAGRAFGEARRRDPRSMAARYFLADHYLKTDDVPKGLAEIAALTRLLPQSIGSVVPYLAAFAHTPGGANEVKAMLRDQPALAPPLLNMLAANPRDAGLALDLWNGISGEGAKRWQERLLNSLVSAGRYPEARSAWRRFNPGYFLNDGLIDPQFKDRLLPPFGWTFASGPAGLADPDGAGQLHILFYGRDDVVLARQLLMLEPGPHWLSMRIDGASPGVRSLGWILHCVAPPRQLAATDFAAARGGHLVMDFTVPTAGCGAQWLELAGTAPDLPEQADVTVADLRLERGGR